MLAVHGQFAAIALDGTSLRGTLARSGGAGVHPMAGITHDSGIVIGRRLVAEGGSEVTWFAPVLDHVPDLTGTVVTADTPHTTRDPAPAMSPAVGATTCSP